MVFKFKCLSRQNGDPEPGWILQQGYNFAVEKRGWWRNASESAHSCDGCRQERDSQGEAQKYRTEIPESGPTCAHRGTSVFMECKARRVSPLVLFTNGLNVSFAVGIEEVFAALLPGGSEFGCGDVPIRAAFPGDGAEVNTKLLDRRAAEKPVAVIDFENEEAGLEDDDVRDHGIVEGVGVFGDVEIFLDDAPGVGEEGPVGIDAASIFIGFCDVVGADGDEATVGDLEFAMELDEALGLAAVFGAKTAAAEN